MHVNETHLTSIKEALEFDRRVTVRELSETADLSVGTVHNILSKELKMRKVKFIFLHKLMFILQGND